MSGPSPFREGASAPELIVDRSGSLCCGLTLDLLRFACSARRGSRLTPQNRTQIDAGLEAVREGAQAQEIAVDPEVDGQRPEVAPAKYLSKQLGAALELVGVAEVKRTALTDRFPHPLTDLLDQLPVVRIQRPIRGQVDRAH